MAAKNPTMKANPVMRVIIDWLLAKLFWILELTKGIVCPKNLIRKIIPAKSIRMRNRGMKIYVAIAGIVKVATTSIRQIAATNANANTMGIIAWKIARKGLPKLLVERLVLIYSGVMLTPPAENKTRKTTAIIRIRYMMQQ